jgi:hypothetical protein
MTDFSKGRDERLARLPISFDSQKYKVLRILPAGQFNPPRLARINRDASRRLLAVQGDALIYGRYLVV